MSGRVSVPVLSNTIVFMWDNLSITLVFLMYKPFFPKILMVFPRVKGIERASAQGQATISTAVNTNIAVSTSPFSIQKINPDKAIRTIVIVKYLLILSDNDLRASPGFA